MLTDMGAMFKEFGDWMTYPFRQNMSIPKLVLFIVLFLVVAYVIHDSLRILKAWTLTAVETVSEAV
jgi:hypothetical protein